MFVDNNNNNDCLPRSGLWRMWLNGGRWSRPSTTDTSPSWTSPSKYICPPVSTLFIHHLFAPIVALSRRRPLVAMFSFSLILKGSLSNSNEVKKQVSYRVKPSDFELIKPDASGLWWFCVSGSGWRGSPSTSTWSGTPSRGWCPTITSCVSGTTTGPAWDAGNKETRRWNPQWVSSLFKKLVFKPVLKPVPDWGLSN